MEASRGSSVRGAVYADVLVPASQPVIAVGGVAAANAALSTPSQLTLAGNTNPLPASAFLNDQWILSGTAVSAACPSASAIFAAFAAAGKALAVGDSFSILALNPTTSGAALWSLSSSGDGTVAAVASPGSLIPGLMSKYQFFVVSLTAATQISFYQF
jgi:hypothetical protein